MCRFVIKEIQLNNICIRHSGKTRSAPQMDIGPYAYDCNYGNSNIICCSQVSGRIIYYLCTTKKFNNVHGFTEIANARRRGRSV